MHFRASDESSLSIGRVNKLTLLPKHIYLTHRWSAFNSFQIPSRSFRHCCFYLPRKERALPLELSACRNVFSDRGLVGTAAINCAQHRSSLLARLICSNYITALSSYRQFPRPSHRCAKRSIAPLGSPANRYLFFSICEKQESVITVWLLSDPNSALGELCRPLEIYNSALGELTQPLEN